MIDSLSAMQKYNPFGKGSKPIWGRVICNKDPKMLGRIKVYIKDLMPFETNEQLPWVYPKEDAGLGQGANHGSFHVPEEGSYVLCEFPYENIYMGYYTGQKKDRLRRLPDFLSEYPERYGTIDSRGNKTIVNKDPTIDTVEKRFADGGLFIYDSCHGSCSFRDKYGTELVVDRRNQYLELRFGGIHIEIGHDTFKLNGSDVVIDSKVLSVVASSVANFAAKSVVSNVEKMSSSHAKFTHGNSDVSFGDKR